MLLKGFTVLREAALHLIYYLSKFCTGMCMCVGETYVSLYPR
jgi:hypothetical protein